MTLRMLFGALALGLPAFLTGCGGGGGGGHDLTVTFGYQGRTYLYQPARLEVRATGLEGVTPNCRVVAGALPAGLTVEPRGCAISGTPTEVKASLVTIRMTADGYEGQVDEQVSIASIGPNVDYGFGALVVGTVVSNRPLPASDVPWVPGAGVTVNYAIASGQLPAGLTLDPSTGEISGIVTSTGSSAFTVAASVSGPLGSTVVTGEQEAPAIGSDGLHFFFAPNDFPVNTQAGTAISLGPLYNFGFRLDGSQYTMANYRLAPHSAPIPNGLALDPATGALTGTAVAGTYTGVVFQVDISSAGKTAALSSSPLTLNVSP